MMHLKYFFLIPLTAIAISSCSRVLSQRTDEQAWMEFDKEVRTQRTPASFTDGQSPGLLSLHEVLANIPVRALLLKCGSSAGAPVCFHSALTLQFDETFRTAQSQFSELRLSDYKREQKTFLEFRSYETVRDEVNRFHQSILSGLDLKARTHAEDLFKNCEGEARKDNVIDNFSVLSSFIFSMPKGTYACLSNRWNSDEKQLLDETTDRLGLSIVTDDAREWIKSQQISPIYEAEINAAVSKRSGEEFEQFKHDKKDLFTGFDAKSPREKLLKEWAPRLRERFPYSPVEQWILSYAKER